MAVKYEYTMYLIFSMLNVYVRTQVKCAGGKTDMVVWMPDTTYVFELKVHGTAQDALVTVPHRGQEGYKGRHSLQQGHSHHRRVGDRPALTLHALWDFNTQQSHTVLQDLGYVTGYHQTDLLLGFVLLVEDAVVMIELVEHLGELVAVVGNARG